MKHPLLFFILLSAVLLLPAYTVLGKASEVTEDPTSLNEGISELGDFATNQGVKTGGTITGFIITVIQGLLALSALLALGALVWGGIMYIMSLGDEGRAGTAKKIIIYAVVGVVVILLSFVIIESIRTLLTK